MKKLNFNISSTKIKAGIIQGLVFATVMSLFDYSSYQPFSTKQFIFYTVFFGCVMSLFVSPNSKTKSN